MLHGQLQWIWGLEERTAHFTALRVSLGFKVGIGAAWFNYLIRCFFAWIEEQRSRNPLKKWVWGLDNLQCMANSLIDSSPGILWKWHRQLFLLKLKLTLFIKQYLCCCFVEFDIDLNWIKPNSKLKEDTQSWRGTVLRVGGAAELREKDEIISSFF